MKNILSLIVAAVLWQAGTASAAITPQITFSQATNAVLSWPSTPGDSFMVLHRAAFHPSTPWRILATNLPAGPFNLTTFTHVGAYRILPGMVITGGGGGGGSSPPGSPAAATLAAPTTDTSTGTTDKAKKKDEGPPALPDEKELEKQYREWLKEWEKQQKNNGGGNSVQTLSATATYTLPDASYTNFTGGFYVITRTTDDTDGDGLPDWWEAANGLSLLVNDAADDPDGDGVPNLAEYAYGTNPRDPNSKPVVYVSYTSPVNTNTYLPVVQITGSINLNVRTLLVDVTNAAGVQTGLEGFVTKRVVIPGSGFTNSPSRYTNSFQCFDVPLTNGANTVTLHFADPYGLTFTTTVSFTVDFNASPAAPVGTVFWPANGAKIGTDTFTLRGRLDNPTASVAARMTIDGEEQEIGGLVERDGTFWIEDLPTPASGPVTLVFTDAGGKATTNTLNLTRSPVSLALYDPSGPNLWDSTMSLNGTVSDPAYSVWVNSKRATVDENGYWSAENVPLNAGGVGSFALRAVPNSDNGGAGSGAAAMTGSGGLGGLYNAPTGNPGSASAVDAAFDFDKPPRIVVSSYTMRSQEDNPTFEYGSTNRATLDWTRSGAGYSGAASSYYEMKYPPYYSPVWRQTQSINYPFPGTNGFEFTSGIYTWGDPFSYTNIINEPGIPWETGATYQRTAERNHSYKGETLLELQTGGRGFASFGSLYEFSASAVAYNAEGGSSNLPPESLRVLEQALDAAGYTYRTNIPANITLALTFAAVNAATQVPTTSQPSSGARTVFSTEKNGILLRGTQQPYYVTPTNRNGVTVSVTNAGPMFLGYSGYVVPYYITRDGYAFDGIVRETVAGTPFANLVLEKTFSPSYSYAAMTWWNGVVPPRQTGPTTYTNQVRNTRQFIDPSNQGSHARLFARKTYMDTNFARVSLFQNPIRYHAKAVVGRGPGVGNAGHLATVAGHLQTARYTVTTDNSLSLSSVTNNVQLGLVWYSFSHGRSLQGDFLGLLVGDNETLSGTNLPPNLKYSLAFLNGCNSANDGLGNVTAMASRFGADCALVGWTGPVYPAVATTTAERFFEVLASGGSVDAAVATVKSEQGTLVAFIGTQSESRFVNEAFQVFRNGGTIIDLK